MQKFVLIAISTSALVCATSFSNDLVLGGPDVVFGTGFGNDPRILTVQVHADGSVESGCNSWSGSTMVVGPSACDSGLGNVGGDEPNPHSSPKFSTPSLSDLSITDASQIGIIFDATQPGAGPISMDSLVLKFYSPAGVLLFVESLKSPPVLFPSTTPGNGKTDFVFVLDAAGISAVNLGIFGTAGFGDDLIALESTMSQAAGGPESFLVTQVDPNGGGGVQTLTPEPMSFLLIGSGLGLLGLLKRVKR